VGELTQQVQAGAGTRGHAARPLRVAPLLDGALDPQPLLGLLGPVGDVADAALAPRGRPPHRVLVDGLRGEVAGGQRLHVGQPAQLLREVVGRPAPLHGALAELVPGRPDHEAAADDAVLAVEVAGDVVGGQVPEALGHGGGGRRGRGRRLLEPLHVEPAPGVSPLSQPAGRVGGRVRGRLQGAGLQLVLGGRGSLLKIGAGRALADPEGVVGNQRRAAARGPVRVAGGGGRGGGEAPPGQVGQRQVDDGVAGRDAGGGRHAVPVAARLQLAPQAVVGGGVREDLRHRRPAAPVGGHGRQHVALALRSPHRCVRWLIVKRGPPGLDRRSAGNRPGTGGRRRSAVGLRLAGIGFLSARRFVVLRAPREELGASVGAEVSTAGFVERGDAGVREKAGRFLGAAAPLDRTLRRPVRRGGRRRRVDYCCAWRRWGVA